MKNTALNTLGYAGTVTLSQRIHDKKIVIKKMHNTGRSALFTFFMDCLLGDFQVAEINLPAKIMLLKYKKETDTYESATNNRYIYLASPPQKVASDTTLAGSVCYSFTVSRDFLQNETACDAIGLYPENAGEGDVNSPMAVCDMAITKQNLSAASALIVDWVLTVADGNNKR